MPLVLLGVRDELVGRPWRPPARHWPGSPLVGGIDEQAGGTWLAVHPDVPRVGCLLNGRGTEADPARRRSRGELPLRAAADGAGVLKELADDPAALRAYDPFHLLCATCAAVTLLSWDGASASTRELAPGTHLLTNAGHAYPPDPAHPNDPAAEPKALHFGPKFAGSRPSADPSLAAAEAWGDWLTLALGDDREPADPSAIIARRDLPDGRVWGTTSVTLVGLAPDTVRYDFQAAPGSPDGWYPVVVALSRGLGQVAGGGHQGGGLGGGGDGDAAAAAEFHHALLLGQHWARAPLKTGGELPCLAVPHAGHQGGRLRPAGPADGDAAPQGQAAHGCERAEVARRRRRDGLESARRAIE